MSLGERATTQNSTPAETMRRVGASRTDNDAVMEALRSADLASSRRRWPLFVLGLLAGGVGAWIANDYLGDTDETEVAAGETTELAEAAVTVETLLEEIEWSGTLGYGDPVSVRGSGGIVTATIPVGETVNRGDTVVTIDNVPMVAFFGDTPMWRSLSEGAEGPDVRQLEANLALMGYDPDATVDVDSDFTANTAAMVERWQEDLGVEITGRVTQNDIALLEGPASVVSVAEVGSSGSGVVATLGPRQGTLDVVSSLDGLVTNLAEIGSEVEAGTVLYRLDDVDVAAIPQDDPVAEMMVSDTFTNLELERALSDNGFDPDGEMTVDGSITDTTVDAVERWQQAVGLPVTGATDPGYYAVVPDDHVVESHLVQSGDSVVTGPIMTTAVSRLSVEVVVDVADADEFETGDSVTIELADDTTVDGVVGDVGAVVPGSNPQEASTVTITIDIVLNAEAGGDESSLVEGPVTVVSIGDSVVDATVVPTRSLVALAEGGFAVEKLDGDGNTQLTGVTLGVFGDGVVEVTDGDLEPGDQVVVPG